MNYRSLGRSGLVVSPLALGTMTFGTARWGLDEGSVAIRMSERPKADMVRLLMLPRSRKAVRGFVHRRRFSFALS